MAQTAIKAMHQAQTMEVKQVSGCQRCNLSGSPYGLWRTREKREG